MMKHKLIEIKMNLVAVATVLLITFHTFEAAVSFNDVPVRLSINGYNKMIASEGYTELLSLSSQRQTQTWKRKTRKYFRRKLNCAGRSEEPCISPFILCGLTVGKSAASRKAVLRNKLLSCTPSKMKKLVQINSLPFYNTDEKTCYHASMTPNVARKLATKVCVSNDRHCLIHSMIPMMKVAAGSITEVTDQVENNSTQIIVLGELSPHHKKIQHDINLSSYVDEIMNSTLTKEDCTSMIEDTFPTTYSNINCEFSLKSLKVQPDLMGDSAISFYITLPENLEQPSIITRDMVLSFIASLAVRPELVGIEVASPYYNYFSTL